MWPVVGHEWAVTLLAHAIESNEVRHAYLFSGPSQVGKTTMARAFAQAICCQSTDTEPPCGVCDACRRCVRDTHPDVRLILPQGRDGQELLIGQVRELIHEAALSPVMGRYKVFILREADRANAPAINALLKTLEEPPPSVILLLTSSSPERLLPTIVSRCQVLSLRSLPTEVVEGKLVEAGAEAEAATLLARLSGGRLGWALDSLTQSEMWEARAEALDELVRLTEVSRWERLAYAATMASKSENVADKLALWATWWRDLLLTQHRCSQAITHVDLRELIEIQAERFSTDQVQTFLRDLTATRRHLERNVNVRLALETLLLHLPRPLVQPLQG